MESDLIVFDALFNATFEEVLAVVSAYLNGLVEVNPDAALEVNTLKEEDKTIWIGRIVEPKEWGKPDIYYGFIEIVPKFFNASSPMRIRLYCSRPEYLPYWAGLRTTLRRHLKPSDGSPGPTNEPWNLVADKSYHRQMLKLWHKRFSAREIGIQLNLSQSTIYEQLGKLRKEYGEVIVPYKYPSRRLKKNP